MMQALAREGRVLPVGGCVEVEHGETELLLIEAFRDCAPMTEDPWDRLDLIFPCVLDRARLGTIYETAAAAFRAYRMGHPQRPAKTWRKAVEVKAAFYGLDLRRDFPIPKADQILEKLEGGEMGLQGELKRIESKGAQGALLPSSSGGTAIVLLERYFEECVEFGRVVEFDPDSLVP
jgi:hypothetical protein